MFSSGQQANNFLLYGSDGAGKTTLAKQILKELEKQPKFLCLYSNCWRYYTQMAVYHLIARALGEAIPRRGLATDEVFDRLLQVLEKTNQKVVIVLDEIDGLLFNKQQRLLYELAYERKYFLVISICNDEKGLTEVDARLKRPLRLTELEVRGVERTELSKPVPRKTELTSEEQAIVSILSNGVVSSTRLYAEFSKKLNRTKRQVRNYLKRLEKRKIIQTSEDFNYPAYFKAKFLRLI